MNATKMTKYNFKMISLFKFHRREEGLKSIHCSAQNTALLPIVDLI